MKINGKFEASFLYADEGIAFTLTCSVVSGKPAETLEWAKNYRPLSLGGPGNISYTFIPEDSNGGENYTCSARNLATDYPLSRSIQLFVNCKIFTILFRYKLFKMQLISSKFSIYNNYIFVVF